MRYRLPDGCDGVTLGGVTLEATDGTIEADAAAAADLAPHGIMPVDVDPASATDVGKSRARPGKT